MSQTLHIYKQGRKARRRGKDQNDNPYPEGVKRSAWVKGWRDETCLIKILSPNPIQGEWT